MNELHRYEMTSPEGTAHMVLERDRVAFEKRGYVVTGSIDPMPESEPEVPGPDMVEETEAAVTADPPADAQPQASSRPRRTTKKKQAEAAVTADPQE